MQSEREWAQAVVRDVASHYLASRRDQVDAFVDRHFGFAGTVRLHGRTLGWDLLRVPANLLLAPVALSVTVLSRITARAGLARLAALLRRDRFVFETAIGREVSWLLTTELLQFPCVQTGRSRSYDALGEMILADPRVAGRLGSADIIPAARREQIAVAIAAYAGTRSATAEITTGCFVGSLGALWGKQVTPGVITLGSVVAGMLAQQWAIADFPLGTGLGGWWYGMYPATPSAHLVATTMGALVFGGALLAVFSGIVTDPVQRLLGVHRRRLLRLIDTLEFGFCGDTAANFPLRDHYVARLLDVLDLTAALLRVSR